MSVDFTEIFSKKLEDIEAPKAKPSGTYLATVQGMPSQRKLAAKDGSDDFLIIGVKFKLQAAKDDVDEDALEEEKDPIHQWPAFTKDFFVSSEGGLFAYKKFLTDTLGIEADSLGEATAQAPGQQCLVSLIHVPFTSRDGTPGIRAQIGDTAAA